MGKLLKRFSCLGSGITILGSGITSVVVTTSFSTSFEIHFCTTFLGALLLLLLPCAYSLPCTCSGRHEKIAGFVAVGLTSFFTSGCNLAPIALPENDFPSWSFLSPSPSSFHEDTTSGGLANIRRRHKRGDKIHS
ncbi:hypothetical protein MTR67_003161 [Solanum verrucosum]|uniref:Uncharacterized protein n=1 Tax=Solanum verrucosum TaxID=315347 RepID=A0AAF0PWD1_SOLVR|nr:hypothetical protein MTR67_003161 [Solanum verrucosum]